MNSIKISSLSLALFVLLLSSCASESTEQEDKNSVNLDFSVTDEEGKKSEGEISINLENPQAALDEVSKALESLNLNKNKDGKELEIINFRELKKNLPERLDGMKRTAHEGQTSGFGGIKVSNAQAEYRDGDKRLDVTITDTGGLGAAVMGMAMWSNLDIDKESDNGFERTTEIDGHKAFLKYDKRRQSSEIAIIYHDRILATLKGRGIDFDDMEDILEDLELEDLDIDN